MDRVITRHFNRDDAKTGTVSGEFDDDRERPYRYLPKPPKQKG